MTQLTHDDTPQGPLRRLTAWKHAPVLLIIALSLFLFFYHLGSYSLWDSDEPIYAEVAKTMAERSDYLTPCWNGDHWYIILSCMHGRAISTL